MSIRTKKIILGIILLTAIVAAGLFIMGRKSASFESPELKTKGEQKAAGTDEKINNSVTPVKILFVGDMMFDRYIRQVVDKKGGEYILTSMKDIFVGNDLIVGNLEGPITDKQSKSVDTEIGTKENYIFTFDPNVVDILKKENIKLVNIGNNHIGNFGKAGVESTREYLQQADIGFFGDPEKESNWSAIQNINGLKIAFVNYNQFVSDGKQRALNDIASAKSAKVDAIILYTHWDKEFVTEPQERTKILAHEFIDNGVDLIIGTHPHVIQSKEEYKGKMIYYSLGNFIFDQYFDPKTQEGLLVQVEINPAKKMQFQEYRVKMKTNGQTTREAD